MSWIRAVETLADGRGFILYRKSKLRLCANQIFAWDVGERLVLWISATSVMLMAGSIDIA